MSLAATYVALTEWIVSLMGGSHSIAHIHAGLAIYVAVQVVTRDRRASLHALIAVAGMELANEIVEAAYYRSPRWGDTLGDIALTLLWPAILYAVSRFRRQRWAAGATRARPVPRAATT
jgi:hypothetical protein